MLPQQETQIAIAKRLRRSEHKCSQVGSEHNRNRWDSAWAKYILKITPIQARTLGKFCKTMLECRDRPSFDCVSRQVIENPYQTKHGSLKKGTLRTIATVQQLQVVKPLSHACSITM